MRRSLIPALLLTGLVACQMQPTRVRETPQPVPPGGQEDAATFVTRVLAQKPVILDVQAPMDYGISHVPGAINTRWEDFSPSGGKSHALDPDHFALARRLALWGLDPGTPVLVVGMGPEGRGEEGRMAWMLRFLGVKQVETGSIRLFRGQIPREDESRPENKPSWKPATRDELEIAPAEFFKRALSKTRIAVPTKARAQALQGGGAPVNPEPARVILDVRHPAEQKVKPLSVLAPQWPVVIFPWRGLYDEFGRVRCAGTQDLAKQGVREGQEILVVDEDGVAAAAVGFALDVCGFGKPRVLSTGLRGLGSVRP
ncbi:MAG: hypothetical protein KF802_03185 [Bdellovibrionaceae bacterium]|nr:hypothetical protein [Pseudobdellovibrionaceae bacterium]